MLAPINDTEFVLSTLVPASLNSRIERIAAGFGVSRNEAVRMAIELLVKTYDEADRIGVFSGAEA